MSDMTPVLGAAPRSAVEVPTEPIYRLTVEQYHQMIAAGILTDDDPIELLGGWLVEKMGKNPQHSFVTQMAGDVLEELLPDGWFVNVQEPITTANSEPEPDLAIVRGDRRDYLTHHPAPADIALIVEVSDTTLQRDRTVKQRIYAQSGIRVYWILNLVEQQLEVYTNPVVTATKAVYGQRAIYKAQQQAPVVIDGAVVGQVSVAALLP